MEYAQERIATLHDLTGRVPDAPAENACVIVPMTERDHASLAAERTLSELERFDPGRVIVALRSSPAKADGVRRWLAGFDLPLTVLWCNAPGVHETLDRYGLDGEAGKGRDVWLALGIAASTHEYVAVHDADGKTTSRGDFARLLAPLGDYEFVKGYYARVENRRFYGRLFRLFVAPLLRALRDREDAPVLAYLDSFRYALSGEIALTADVARSVRAERDFGFEVGSLGDAFAEAGFERTAQVDLGRYEHDHRAVSGPSGLSEMAEDVGAALFRVIEEYGVDPDYDALGEVYREGAERLIEQYAADADFNDLEYDPGAERDQVGAYAGAIHPPEGDDRLPACRDVDLDPDEVVRASCEALEGSR